MAEGSVLGSRMGESRECRDAPDDASDLIGLAHLGASSVPLSFDRPRTHSACEGGSVTDPETVRRSSFSSRRDVHGAPPMRSR